MCVFIIIKQHRTQPVVASVSQTVPFSGKGPTGTSLSLCALVLRCDRTLCALCLLWCCGVVSQPGIQPASEEEIRAFTSEKYWLVDVSALVLRCGIPTWYTTSQRGGDPGLHVREVLARRRALSHR